MTPVKKQVPVKKRLSMRGPKTQTASVSDKESKSSQVLEDLDFPIVESVSEDESQLEIERLRIKLVKLEADQRSCIPLEEKRLQLVPQTGTHHVRSPPVSDFNCNRPQSRQLDLKNESTLSSKQVPELKENMARRLEELENDVQSLRADAQRQILCFPDTPSNSSVRQYVQDSGSMMTDGSTRDSGTANSTHETYVPISRRKQGVRQDPRNCYNCGEVGHIRRDCKKPRFSDLASGSGPQGPRSDSNTNMTGDRVPEEKILVYARQPKQDGSIFRVRLGSQRVLALLDSGCEQFVVGRTLIKNVPLEPTNEELSTADGTDIPLLGETTNYFPVSGFETSCRVVVTNVLTELILDMVWIRRNQCVWDFGSNTFVINGHQGRLSCRGEKQTVPKHYCG